MGKFCITDSKYVAEPSLNLSQNYLICLYDIYTLLVYLFVCLCPKNVKTAESIQSNFFVGPHMTEGLFMLRISKNCLQNNLTFVKFLKSSNKYDEISKLEV